MDPTRFDEFLEDLDDAPQIDSIKTQLLNANPMIGSVKALLNVVRGNSKSEATALLERNLVLSELDASALAGLLAAYQARLDQQQQMTQIATSQPAQVIDYAAIAEAMKPLIAEALPAVVNQFQYFKVSATITNSRNVRAWRARIFTLADAHGGYYSEDGESSSIFYQGDDLQLAILFQSKENARHFRVDLEKKCLNFQINRVTVAERYDVVFLSSEAAEIRAKHYQHGDSESPPHTLALSDYKSQPNEEEVSVCNAPDGYQKLQMIEDANHLFLYGKEMYKCHIASKASYPKYKNNKNNFLYLTQSTYQCFDGLNLATKEHMIPSLAIHFEKFGDRETFEYENGHPFVKQKVHVSLESPDNRLLESLGLTLKPGSYSQEGKWFTFVHVDDGAEFKQFLDIKYNETQALWNEDEGSQDAEASAMNIGQLKIGSS